MASNCPPQLHLTLPTNTTSFKRSFEEFGFDLESPVGNEASGSGSSSQSSGSGHDRNKRPRSASTFSDETGSGDDAISLVIPTVGTGTTSSESEEAHSASTNPTRPSSATSLSIEMPTTSLEPPRLPTPEIQDIEMSDYPLAQEEDEVEEREEGIFDEEEEQPIVEPYRLTLSFDDEPRAETPPPMLPPLATLAPLSDNDEHEASYDGIDGAFASLPPCLSCS